MTSQFEYVSRGTSVRYVELHAAFRASELDAFLAEHKCDDVTINQIHGRGQADLDEALCSRRAKRLTVVLDSASLSQLASNRVIERLYFSGRLREDFDFSRAKSLRSLTIQWQKGVEGLNLMSWLEELTLRGFTGDQIFLENLSFLTTLGLIETDLLSVEFLTSFANLRRVELSYARKLVNMEGLLFTKNSLLELELSHLPKIREYGEVLSSLKKLKTLKVTKCPPLRNVEFVRGLPDLEFFSFVDTDVLSGDLTPCLGLKYVGFLDKKKYSHTWDRRNGRLELKTKPKVQAR